MSISNKFDIIIIGSGVSGLILANEITERTNKRVLLLEKKKRFHLIRIYVFGIYLIIFYQIQLIINGIKYQ